MAHDVFVSYSSKDKAIADTIVAALENNQIRCWYAPRDIKPGEDWGNAITTAVINARIFLMIFSGNANQSQRVLDELNFAISQQAVILPFRIENLEPKGAMKLHLASRHWLDAYEPSWHSHLKKLVKTISDNLDKSIEDQQIVLPASIEKKISQQQKKKNRIVAGVVFAALIISAGWFGWSSMNKRDSEAAAASQIETKTPQNYFMAQEPQSTETSAPATPEPTIEPTLYDSSSELGIPDYQTDFSSVENATYWGGNYMLDNNTLRIVDGNAFVANIYGYDRATSAHDAIIEVDSKLNTAPGLSQGKIEIFCRSKEETGSYGAGLNTFGKIYISKYYQGSTTDIFSKMITPIVIGRYYRLRFDCIGKTFTVYLDGEKVGEAEDNSFFAGGLGVSTEGNAVFDNFKLWLP